MHSTAYTAMLQQMEAGAYTEVSAKNTLDDLYARQRLTHDEYSELMDKANTLSTNSQDGETLIRIVALETSVKTLTGEVVAIKQAVEGESTVVPEPKPGQTGSEDDPIDAVRGMVYTKDLYYRDPEDGQVYLCHRDSDTEPGSGIALAYLPHELAGIYFTLVA